MSIEQRVHYKKAYGRMLIVLGILFTSIFILGYFIAEIGDAIFYCLMSAVLIVVGFGILSGPYATYDSSSIQLYNFTGKSRKEYSFSDQSDIQVKGSHFYLKGDKLKMNKWFMNEEEWQRMINFYSSDADSLFTELRDDSSSL